MEVIEAYDRIAECFRDARATFQVGLNASERLLDLAQQAVSEMTLLRGDMRHADLDGPYVATLPCGYNKKDPST